MLKISLKGTPKQIGHVHGETFKTQIKELVEIRRKLSSGFFGPNSVEVLNKYANEQVESLKNEPDLFEEFEAICQASGVTTTDLMILNNYTDLRDFSVLETSRKEGGCSVIGINTREGVIAGQTWDMHASATPYTVFMEIEESAHKETKIHALTLTGCLGLAGVNSHGVSAMINNMHCTEVNRKGLAWNALVRKILRSKTASDAVGVLKNNLPCSGHSYVVADAQQAINVETTGLQVEVTAELSKQTPYLFHTNHYLSPKLKKHENLERQSKTTHQRYEALDRYLKTHDVAGFDLNAFEREFFAQTPTGSVICMPAPTDPHGPMTSGGLILDLKQRQGLAFKGVYSDKNHHRFKF